MADIKNSDRIQVAEDRQRRSPLHMCETKQLKEMHVLTEKGDVLFAFTIDFICGMRMYWHRRNIVFCLSEVERKVELILR